MPKKPQPKKTTKKSKSSYKATRKSTSGRKKNHRGDFNFKPYLYALAFLFVGGFLFVSLYVFFEKANAKKESTQIVEIKKPAATKSISKVSSLTQSPKDIVPEAKPLNEKSVTLDSPKDILPETKPSNEMVVATEQPKNVLPEDKPKVEVFTLDPKIAAIQPVFTEQKGPKIAIVIDDVGVDFNRSARAIALPKEVTLSFLAYASKIKEQTKIARDKGHELLVHVPMEADSGKDAGLKTLLVKSSDKDLKEHLQWHLSQFDGFIGINNHMGSKFTASKEPLQKLMEDIKARKLFFLDSKTTMKSLVPELAKECKVPCIERDVFLDHDPTLKAIEIQLKLVEDIALKNGIAIAIGHPKDDTLNALEKWIPTLMKKGYNLVPVSALVLPWQ
ncbi:MAG: divergent polysaccharide deacetylase family protein [Alphaproteobacteria bacterium]|nr:divergent polysaccharide deacetylase family protein [Alphaproteobacteria bacterium]